MSERKYYCLCDSNCKFETLNKEQILSAITQACSGAAVIDPDASPISKVKEGNAGKSVTFWVGTQAQYNAIAAKDPYCVYVITDSTKDADIVNSIAGAYTEAAAAMEAAVKAQETANGKAPKNYIGDVAAYHNGGSLNGTLNTMIKEMSADIDAGGICVRHLSYKNVPELGDAEGFVRFYKKGNGCTALFENITGTTRWLRYYNPATGWGEYQFIKYANASNLDGTTTINSSVFTVDDALSNQLENMRDNDLHIFRLVHNDVYLPDMAITMDAIVHMHRFAAGTGYANIEAYDPNQGRTYRYRKTCYNGVWSDYECYDPAMLVGVEYRTTEYWDGHVVYRKMIKYTNDAALAGDKMHTIPHGCTNMNRSYGAEIVCRTQGYQIPYINSNESTAVVGCSATAIEMRTTGNTNWSAGREWYFDMKYIKNTN